MNQITMEEKEDLNIRLLKALAAHPVTNTAIIELINENGVITIIGEVDNLEVRQAVREVVENQPGVLSVVNNLKVKH